MSLKYQDPLGVDWDMVKAANRRFDRETGFRETAAQLGIPRLKYPPYVPAVPGYRMPPAGPAAEAMTERILEWNDRWITGQSQLVAGQNANGLPVRDGHVG